MKKFKLAIVEDDEDERFFMTEALTAFDGFEILAEFSNGDQALEWLRSGPQPAPQLLLSDLNMPGISGYELISEVKKSFPQIPVFATSTSNLPSTREKCLHLGAQEFLAKPEVFISYDRYAKTLYELAYQSLSEN
jgi:CheY-like chemotaxis protein